MYLTDPSAICKWDGVASDKLFIQKGDDPRNVVQLPATYDAAANATDAWVMDHFFLSMGHHVTYKEGRDDCVKQMPIQALYAEVDEQCVSSGFVWVHIAFG